MYFSDFLYNRFFKEGFFTCNRVYIFFGSTATGKTKLAISFAKKIDAEIINCDMAQIYSEIKIGVGQIKEEEKDGVVHHLFGFLEQPTLFSVYQMREKIELIIALILSRNRNVIIVGGSSFCVYSLFFAPSLFYYSSCDYDGFLLHERSKLVKTVFPYAREEKIKKDCIVFFPKYDYIVVFFDNYFCSRDIWLEDIKSRIDFFLHSGWIEEIKGMSIEWLDFVLKKKFIGYTELINYINGKSLVDLTEVKNIIFFRTCQYAKKQRTFLRKMKRDFILNTVFFVDYFTEHERII